MHTRMDIHDLLITAEESLSQIAKEIEALARDAVYAYVEDGELQIQFGDTSRILAKGDPESGELVLDAPNRHFRFYWDDVEEGWYSKEQDYPLRPVIEKLIEEHTGENVTLDADE